MFPKVSRPSPGTVDIWSFPLNDADWESACLPLLCESERNRSARYTFPDGKRRSAVARAGLRSILASYRNCDPTELAFDYGPHGKPSLVDGAGLEFNISHSCEVAVVAVTTEHAVGIDIESFTRKVDHRPLARRYFSPREIEHLEALSSDELNRDFFRIWTGKEAFIKCLGDGLAYPLDQFAVDLRNDGRHATWVAPGQARGHDIRFAEVPNTIPGFAVTIGLRAEIGNVHLQSRLP